MDFFGSMNTYNYSRHGEEADTVALASDLLAIYKDFYKSYYDTVCQLEVKKSAV
jgi:hypothetical protein